MNGREYKYYSGDCKECHGYDMVHDVADNWLDTLKHVNERRRNSYKPPIFPSNVELYIYGTKTDFNIEEYTQEYIKEEMDKYNKKEKISGRELAEKYNMNPMPEEAANISKFVASLRFRRGL